MMLDEVIDGLMQIRNKHGNIPVMVTTEHGEDSCDALELVDSSIEPVFGVYGIAVLVW